MDRPSPPGTLLARERGGIVLGWLIRVCVVVLVVGLLAFDGLSVLVADLGVRDEAGRAAREAAADYADSGNARGAYDAATADLGDGSTIVPGSFSVTPDGTVTLEVEKTAPSLLLDHTDRTAAYTRVSATATARFTS